MRNTAALLLTATVGATLFISSGPSYAQTRALSQPECQALRERLAEHAKLSDGVRRLIADRVTRYAAPPRPSAAPSGQAGVIRARLEQIPRERQQLDEQRLAAMGRLDFMRAFQFRGQIEALEAEKLKLEKELAALPPVTSTPPPSPPATPSVGDVDRFPCNEVATTYEAAIKIRRRELGAQEDQSGVIPLMGLKGQTREQIAQELASQFAAWPEAAGQIGLLDQTGDGRVDGFVDIPIRDVFRLFREQADGSVGIDAFAKPGRTADSEYSEAARRLDEAAIRHAGQRLLDLLPSRPAGPLRVIAETGEFSAAYAQLLAGNFAEASRLVAAAARSLEFQNFRGETVRLLEVLAPAPSGLVIRRVVTTPRPNNQEMWEETSFAARAVTYWRTEFEVTTSRQTRTTTGTPVGAPSTAAPGRFNLDR